MTDTLPAGQPENLSARQLQVQHYIEVIVHDAETGAGRPLNMHGRYKALVRERGEIMAKLRAHYGVTDSGRPDHPPSYVPG
jgi:hypothetical protein